MKYSIFLLLMITARICIAQPGDDRRLEITSSSAGNYIYFYGAEGKGVDSDIMKATSSFIVERVTLDESGNPRDSKYTHIAEVGTVSSVSQLHNSFTARQIAEMISAFKLSSAEDLVNYFRTRKLPRNFSLYYLSLRVRIALGHVFLDPDVKPGEIVRYRVARREGNGNPLPWATGIIVSKTGNLALPYFKPWLAATKTFDSGILLTWKMRVGADIAKQVHLPRSPLPGDTEGIAFGRSEDGTQLRATAKIIRNGNVSELADMYPVPNVHKDTVTFTRYIAALPHEKVAAFMVVRDDVGNNGLSSDTTAAYVVTASDLPLIYGVHVEEIIDGIKLTWTQLPPKPYITGVLITRTDAREIVDTVATLRTWDTVFTDRNIEPGLVYVYSVRPLYQPGLGLTQEMPATGTGSYTKFSKPETPANLKAVNEGRHIRLTWDTSRKKGLFGYYIYRGTTPKSLDLIAGPIKQCTFLDTSHSLSARSKYYYTIESQDMVQQTSPRSNMVVIAPKRSIDIASPANIRFFYVNKGLDVGWNDVKEYDSAIAGYVLQKAKDTAIDFRPVPLKNFTMPGATDTVIERGVRYFYRVAAVSILGDTSAYSRPFEYSLPLRLPAQLTTFYLRNVQAGVVISWPRELYKNRKTYNVYRRKANEEEYALIGHANDRTFEFTDEHVEEQQTYIYSVTITETDNREGTKAPSQSIRRTKGPAPTVIR